MKKYLPVAVVVVVIAIIVGIALGNKKDDKKSMPSMSNTQSSSSNSSQPKASNKVSIANFNYSPDIITVKKGTMVTWTNNDSSAHTVSADKDNTFESGTLDKGKTFSFKFNEAGTFAYHCTFHPSMHGKVVVTP
jgi:plastocyanin